MLGGAQPSWNGPHGDSARQRLSQAAGSWATAASKAAFVWAPAEVESDLSQVPQGRVWGSAVVVKAAVTIIVAIDTVLPVGDFS